MGCKVAIQDLEKSYQGKKVLDKVSLTIEPGEFVSIVGPSGCGKSTILEILGGLRSRDTGTVTIDGDDIQGPRQTTGIIFQESSTLPWRNSLDNVSLALEVRGEEKKVRYEAAREALRAVGLRDFETYYPAQLSGGMRQRIALARVLTISPTLILADEPFGALDEQTRLIMALELLSVVSDRITVLFITHSIQEAVLLSDRVLVMGTRPGRIIDEISIDLDRPRTSGL